MRLELAPQQQRLLAGLPGMRHLLGGGLGVAGQPVPADVDAGRDDQPVVREARAALERDAARLRRRRRSPWRRRPRCRSAADLVVAELLGRQRPQAADHQVAERAGREGAAALDQAHGDARDRRLLMARAAAGAGEAATDHHHARGGLGATPARQGGRRRRRPPARPGTAGGSSAGRAISASLSLRAAYHSAMAWTSASEKPLAIRPMTVLGRCPLLKACIWRDELGGAATVKPGTAVRRRAQRMTARAGAGAWRRLGPCGAQPGTSSKRREDKEPHATLAASPIRSTSSSNRHGLLLATLRSDQIDLLVLQRQVRTRLPVAAK